MENSHHKVYGRIDVHCQEHRVAIMAIALLQRPESNCREAKFLTIKINSSDFERQDAAIREHILYPDEVVVAVDHSGGHYSEPLVYFLQGKHYNVYHLEAWGLA